MHMWSSAYDAHADVHLFVFIAGARAHERWLIGAHNTTFAIHVPSMVQPLQAEHGAQPSHDSMRCVFLSLQSMPVHSLDDPWISGSSIDALPPASSASSDASAASTAPARWSWELAPCLSRTDALTAFHALLFCMLPRSGHEQPFDRTAFCEYA